MQKDFHYCVIRVLSEKAGFQQEEAQIIAYASQYTDDAVEHQKLKISGVPDIEYERFDGQYFDPICTAHRGIQYITGLNKDVQRKVYIPFHFLPSEEYDNGSYDYCSVPNGNFARKLVKNAIKELNESDEKRKQGLIKLGIALHTYADNWSHQRFSGRHSSKDNDIERIHIFENGKWEPIPVWDQFKLNVIPDVGHAEALYYPDQSHLNWKYEHDYSGIEIPRDNKLIFLDAAYSIFALLCEANQKVLDWKKYVNRLEECLSVPTDSLKKKFQTYQNVFPEIDFNYNEEDWRNQALKGDSFDWYDFDGDDYEAQEYEFNEDLKWFYFHMEALKQRELVIQGIKKDLR
jgi:hypothetical protein